MNAPGDAGTLDSRPRFDQGLEERLWGVIQEQNDRIEALEQEYRKLTSMVGGMSREPSSHPGVRNRERSTDQSKYGAQDHYTDPVQSPMMTSRMQPYRYQTDEEHRPSEAISPLFQSHTNLDQSTTAAATTTATTTMVGNSSTTSSRAGYHANSTHTTPAVTRVHKDDHGATSSPSGVPLTSPQIAATPQSSMPPGTDNAPLSAGTPNMHAVTTTSAAQASANQPKVSDSAQKSAKDAAGAAAKSFRVTLEDPCYKVLPAALKKYKIDDDWRMYAMFICYANTGKLVPPIF